MGWLIGAALLTAVMAQIADARGASLPLMEYVLPSAAYATTWVVLLPMVIVVGRRLPFDARNSWWRMPLAAAARPVLALIATLAQLSLYFVVMTVVSTSFAPTSAVQWEESGGVFYLGRFYEGIALVLVTLIVDALWTRARTEHARQLHEARLAAQLTEARLSALSMELQPHFLFNTLNAISTLVHRDQHAADRMIAKLSTLLRRTLEAGRQPMASLHEEIQLLELYLDIQRIRFGERLTVTVNVSDNVRDAQMPRLLLQPLVENAMQHGLAHKPGPITLAIRAHRAGAMLTVCIDDSGIGVSEPITEGTGLRNTRARLQQLYDGRHALLLLPSAGGGTRVRLEIPYGES